MAILVVDDESNTREALRLLLKEFSQESVLEAKNGTEAFKLLEHEKDRIRFIIVDWEMPYMSGLELLQKIQLHPQFNLLPFLMISSDIPNFKLNKMKETHPRLDGFLIKPFGERALFDAMDMAYSARAHTRDIFVYYHQENTLLSQTMAQEILQNSGFHWKKILFVNSLAEIEAAFDTLKEKTGAVFFEADEKFDLSIEHLAVIKKRPWGLNIPFACAGQKLKDLVPLRTLCQFFFTPPFSSKNILLDLSSFLKSKWKINLIYHEAKLDFDNKNFSIAIKKISEIMKINNPFPDFLVLMADILETRNEDKQAINYYLKALQINPFLPQIYVKLKKYFKDLDNEVKEKITTLALLCCPEHPELKRLFLK